MSVSTFSFRRTPLRSGLYFLPSAALTPQRQSQAISAEAVGPTEVKHSLPDLVRVSAGSNVRALAKRGAQLYPQH